MENATGEWIGAGTWGTVGVAQGTGAELGAVVGELEIVVEDLHQGLWSPHCPV